MEYSKCCIPTKREYYLNFHTHSITVFCDASWVGVSLPAGLGFVIALNFNHIIIAGADAIVAESSVVAELFAVKVALEHCCSWSIWPDLILTGCTGVVDCLTSAYLQVTWRFTDVIEDLIQFPLNKLDLIPHDS